MNGRDHELSRRGSRPVMVLHRPGMTRSTALVPCSLAVLLSLCAASCSDDEVVAPAPVPDASPPAWFALFPEDQRMAFVGELERWFRAKRLVPELAANGVLVVRGAPSGPQDFDLDLIAELCASAPRAEWSQLVDAHLSRVTAMRDALASVELMTWEEARDQLRLRIQPLAFLEEGGLRLEDVAGAVDLPGTATLAFIDREDSAIVVSRGSLERWRQHPTGVLALAMVNTMRALEKELRIDAQDVGALGKLYAITSGSYYGASVVLWIDRHPEMLGEHGAIVAIPARDAVFVWPLDDARVKDVIPALRQLGAQAAAAMGGALDDGVFWRRPEGGFERIEIVVKDGKLEITPPPDLARLIAEFDKR